MGFEGGCGYDGGRRGGGGGDYVSRSQEMLAAGRVAAAGSALAAHGVDLSDTASLQLALHGASIHGLHALDDVAQVVGQGRVQIASSHLILTRPV